MKFLIHMCLLSVAIVIHLHGGLFSLHAYSSSSTCTDIAVRTNVLQVQ